MVSLFKHVKDMEYKVRVDRPDPRFAVLLLEQFGGPHGELKAAMQYFTQAMGCQDPRMRDLFMDICAEEMSHFEMVGTAIKMLGGNPDQVPALHGAPSLAILGGGGPILTNSAGVPWSAAYIETTGDIVADLRSNVAAELRAKLVYERLLQHTDDPGVRDMIRFLLSREESHSTSFAQALSTVQGTQGVMQDFRDSTFSKKYFDLSTGPQNYRGPWNQGNDFQYEKNPHQQYGGPPAYGTDPRPNASGEFGPGRGDQIRNNPTGPQ